MDNDGDWLVGRRFASWHVDAFLARGGMASVWLVHHERLGVHAVMKVPLGADDDLLARAAREGRIQSALLHDNIVRGLDVVDVGGRPGIVLERIGGGLALDGLLRMGPIESGQSTTLFEGILAGVQAAHEAGYIHRDLKPGNVLLAGESGAYQAKICDFGLARPEHEPAENKLTRAGYILGSAAYMAPEQARDAATVDAAADIWSLGCILYELWSGVPAFPGERVDDVLVNVVAGRFRPLDSLVANVPSAVVLAVEACLKVEPMERPPTVAVLREIWKGERPWTGGGGPVRRSLGGIPAKRPATSSPPSSSNITFVSEPGRPGSPAPRWVFAAAVVVVIAICLWAALGW